MVFFVVTLLFRYPDLKLDDVFSVLGGSAQDLDAWLITKVIVSPLSRAVRPLPNGLLLTNWDDPPSGSQIW